MGFIPFTRCTHERNTLNPVFQDQPRDVLLPSARLESKAKGGGPAHGRPPASIYGSTRTIVGFGRPATPVYATDPRYFVQAILECMMLGGEVVEFLVRLQQQFLEAL